VAGVRQAGGRHSVSEEFEAVATRVASQASSASRLRGIDVADHIGFALVFGDSVVGVLGVVQDQRPLTEAQRRILAAAAPLLAIAIKNAQLFAGLRDTTIHDSLTGCFTRARALESLDTELRRSERSGLPLSVIMIDLDHFKQINDRHGHQAGDAVLSMVGRHLRDVLRKSDIPSRYGGEEFLLVLPDTSAAGARLVAESLRQALEQLVVRWEQAAIPITASFGVASRAGDRSVSSLVARADAALYGAKQAGRNCVREHEDPAPPVSETRPQHDRDLRMVVPTR
jgi:diguanylate cyclase (GGDEF)-like protein